jgi:signal transduction histidine kinase
MTRVCGRLQLRAQVSLSSNPSAPTPSTAETGLAQFRGLTETSRALTYATSLDDVTRLTVQRSATLLHASAAVLMLPDSDGSLRVRGAHGVDVELLDRFSAPLGDELLERLRGLLSVNEDCFIAVPLIVGGQVTGILATAGPQPFTEADEWLLSALADHSAVAVENARQIGEVRVEMEGRLRANEGAMNAKDRALETLAHDIRTPLGAIEGYCGILEEGMQGPVNDRQRDTLGRIRMSGRHLLSLLDTVMDMARIEAGVIRFSPEPTRLSAIAREAVQLAEPSATSKLQTIEIDVQSDATVNVDPARLRQILINLIGNAVKFTPRNGRITVTVAQTESGSTCCGEVTVTDTGPGIAASEQAAVFEPYYRSEGTAHAPGVGLGLAISHGLLKQMHGELSLTSELGAGATFIVRLPINAAV